MDTELCHKDRLIAKAVASKGSAARVLRTVRIGDGEIVACDGHILVRRSLHMIGDPILVNPEAISCRRKRSVTRISSNSDLSCEVTHTGEYPKKYPLVIDQYPDYDSLCPKGPPSLQVSFRVDVLRKLLSTIESDRYITLSFYTAGQAVRFEAGNTHGLIMPSCPL